MSFLYFVPESMKTTVEKFTSSRRDVFGDDAQCGERSCSAGPNGGPGMILGVNYREDSRMKIGYYPQNQTWEKTPSGWWIGIQNDSRPLPHTISRPRMYQGHEITLQDENSWLIPVARRHDGTPAFPTVLKYGKPSDTPQPQFQTLCKHAEDFWGQICGVLNETGQISFEVEEGWTWAIEALKVNYHLGEEEASVMGLLAEDQIGNILQAIIDLPTLIVLLGIVNAVADQKKTTDTQDMFSTDSGVKDLPETMNQLTQTSN